MNSYWDLYVAYVHHCVEYNKKHDIDPHHYRMEWNHFLPKSVFGDQPLGQYLLLKQHAIASALQTLSFKKRCMFGWHKKYLPDPLLKLAWPYYCEASKKQGKETARMELGAHAPQHRGKGGRKTVERKTGIHGSSPEKRSEDARKAAKKMVDLKIGVHGLTKEERTENSRKGGENAVKMKAGFHAPQHRGKGAKVTNTQTWRSLIDGYQGNAGNVARHNKLNGWDPSARVQILTTYE